MTTHTGEPVQDAFAEGRLVYIKPLDSDAAQAMIAPNALQDVGDLDDLFAVYGPDGQPLAIVEGREAAYAAAKAHSLKPASLH